jgi:hypothetical protein
VNTYDPADRIVYLRVAPESAGSRRRPAAGNNQVAAEPTGGTVRADQDPSAGCEASSSVSARPSAHGRWGSTHDVGRHDASPRGQMTRSIHRERGD